MAFIIRSINVYNYSMTNQGIQGEISFLEDSTKAEMKIKMNEEDAARIFEVFADRINATMQAAASSVLEAVSLQRPEPAPQITAPVDDDIPF